LNDDSGKPDDPATQEFYKFLNPLVGQKWLEARYFTQSAGLVAIHPVADALADEFAVFAWRLRAEAFLRFGYDPEGAFSASIRYAG
jgi:hypothetical protein